MVVDAQAPITIRVLATPFAVLDAIRSLDSATGVWYSLYPEGQQGYCTKGYTCWLNFRIRNGGDAAGSVYVKISKNDGTVIYNQSWTLQVGEYFDVSANGPNFVMGTVDETLTFEIGHT